VQEGDLDKALSVFTDDVERTMSGVGTLHGVDAFRAVIAVFPTAFPDIEFMVDTWIETDDTLVVEGRVGGTNTGPLKTPQGEIPATGRRLDLPFVDVLKARGGKISLLHVYFDRLEMMSQLGLIAGQDGATPVK
jgi:ketosteroid isomerase-like protein